MLIGWYEAICTNRLLMRLLKDSFIYDYSDMQNVIGENFASM